MNQSLGVSQLPSVMGHDGRDLKPVPISNQYGFTPENMPRDEIIKFFCKESLMPLCTICVSQHQEDQTRQGKRTNIIPLEAVLTEVYSKLSTFANDLQYSFERLMTFQDHSLLQGIGDKQSLLTNPIQLIESARNQVHSIVDNYFNTLSTFIKSRVPEQLIKTPDTSQLSYDLKIKWDEAIRDLELLNSQQCLPQLIQYYQGDITKDGSRLLQESNFKLREVEQIILRGPVGIEIPQLHIDPLYLQKFLWALERYAFFYEPPFEPFEPIGLNYLPPPQPSFIHPLERIHLPPPVDHRVRYDFDYERPPYYQDDRYNEDDRYYEERIEKKQRQPIIETVQTVSKTVKAKKKKQPKIIYHHIPGPAPSNVTGLSVVAPNQGFINNQIPNVPMTLPSNVTVVNPLQVPSQVPQIVSNTRSKTNLANNPYA